MSGRGGKARGPGPRSYEALRWLARLDVARIEPLGLAMGFGRRATYSHLARLMDAGLVTREFDRGGSVVAITAAGRRAIDAPRSRTPVGATHGLGLRHARAVSWVAGRLTCNQREWIDRRELRRDPAWRSEVVWRLTRDGHYPDVGILLPSTRVAVEVQLWHRPAPRLRAILAGYEEAVANGQLGGVIFVSDRADVLATIERAQRQSGLPSRHIQLRALQGIQSSTRAGNAPSAPSP